MYTIFELFNNEYISLGTFNSYELAKNEYDRLNCKTVFIRFPDNSLNVFI